MAYEDLKKEIERLKNMAKAENDPDTRMAIYDSIASYGKMAREDLLDLVEVEKDETAKKYCLARIKNASEK